MVYYYIKLPRRRSETERICGGKKEAKKAVAKAQQKERERFGERLDTKEGKRSIYGIAKQMAGERKDIVDMKYLKNESGAVLIEADAVKERWREYMERLFNIENDWDGVLEGDKVEGPCELINEKEVEEGNQGHESRKGRRTIRGGGRNVESSWKERNKMVDRAIQPGGRRRGNSKRMGTQHPHTHF